MITEVYSPSRFIWKIDNFSTRKSHSDDFMAGGGFKWKAKVDYPVFLFRTPYVYFTVSLAPDDSTKFPSLEVSFSVAITSQTNDYNTLRYDFKHTFTGKKNFRSPVIRLREILDSSKGYIVNDSCVIKFEVSRCVNKDPMDNDVKESDPDNCSVSTMQIKPKDCESSVDIEEHHGHSFEEGGHNYFKGGFCEGMRQI
ncbi:hypothetical protein MKX03_007847 [Papaver bracteatum]|nr:hypothetical protein MKX03_007847 [Papaver bracteatum]